MLKEGIVLVTSPTWLHPSTWLHPPYLVPSWLHPPYLVTFPLFGYIPPTWLHNSQATFFMAGITKNLWNSQAFLP